MPLKSGALLIVIGWTALLGACSQPEEENMSSPGANQPVTEIVEVDGAQNPTDDQEVFLLEQQTQEGEIVDFGNPENSGLSKAPEEQPSN
ncbi:hypothetical protein NIES593_09355 [Hydrococcus rivularis NIES-593]|uniref:Uncharacterized protein n=1 Tax=Hydrococcus rivularis NIES-593 TaxID=1921803 RepID=A0A1U7HJV0_9CYAN|nr:hypothetical protein [Hydrococcus rivularis]OKH23847.1 hypothetical protein NIES593_09355 [Hydrococcus rivularis NIES-593]